MRMWMINPKKMCNQHLLGEHVELHMLVGSIKKGISLEGYCKNKLIEPKLILKRHEELVKEMKKRGMNHKSPLKISNLKKLPKCILNSKVDKKKAKRDILKRCKQCRIRFKQ